jgi:hypothetical protein
MPRIENVGSRAWHMYMLQTFNAHVCKGSEISTKLLLNPVTASAEVGEAYEYMPTNAKRTKKQTLGMQTRQGQQVS